MAKVRKNPARYHRVICEESCDFDNGQLRIPLSYIDRIAPGHGLLVASWDEEVALGFVDCLGVATSVDLNSGTVYGVLTQVKIKLRPKPAGRRWWREGCFGFAPAVADRYMLDDLFTEFFPEYTEVHFSKVVKTANRPRRYQERAGYVYVLKSEYGYKIGKAVNVTDRVKQFGVKLPFKWSIEMTLQSDNYSKLEADLHRWYSAKRLEGEWFALDENDLKEIKNWPDQLHED